MAERPRLRAAQEEDRTSIRHLIAAVFPDEDAAIAAAVEGTFDAEPDAVCLIAEGTGDPLGCVLFSACRIGTTSAWLLAPLGVLEGWRGRGLGRALVEAGLATCARHRPGPVCVLGDPAYYGRFGFRATREILPPCPIPEAWAGAWQVLVPAGASDPPAGRLEVPQAWAHPALWTN